MSYHQFAIVHLRLLKIGLNSKGMKLRWMKIWAKGSETWLLSSQQTLISVRSSVVALACTTLLALLRAGVYFLRRNIGLRGVCLTQAYLFNTFPAFWAYGYAGTLSNFDFCWVILVRSIELFCRKCLICLISHRFQSSVSYFPTNLPENMLAAWVIFQKRLSKAWVVSCHQDFTVLELISQ